jgi:hypothetical protein
MTRTVLCLAGLLAFSAAAQQGSGLATVELRNVSASVAKSVEVDEGRLPGTVQLPMGVAAQVCGVDATALARRGMAANCMASATSVALEQEVRRQLRLDRDPTAGARTSLGSGTGTEEPRPAKDRSDERKP